MKKVEKKLDLWKNKLLDLGKRNRLINFKDTRSSTLRLTAPSCSELYSFFVNDENVIRFPVAQDPDDEDGLTDTPDEKDDDASFVKTDKKGAERQHVLRNLRDKAKTAMEEQGVNMLFLCFGFLNYTESLKSSVFLKAPLVLVPVTLTVESITAPYELRLHEDEITVNPTLAYKLFREYNVTLPSFEENGDLSAFFNEVRKIDVDKRWTVEEDVCLGIFSFLKINMYHDLEAHKETVAENPIIRALCGDRSGLEKIPSGLDTYDFDGNDDPKDVFQIVDADSSQQEAILLAKKGVSFVLQGPPGTGKSQTITNIIAESIADGKKVLFVSEKMAALEVVFHRLQSAGLDDFCLVLHSSKANKRAVLDQLEKTLQLSQKKVLMTDEAYRKLHTLQQKRIELNEYDAQLHTPVGPLKKTFYEVDGILGNLEPYADIIFDIPDVKSTTQDRYEQYLYLLTNMAEICGKMTDDILSLPWYGAVLPSVTNEFRHDVGAKLPDLAFRLADMVQKAESFREFSGVSMSFTMNSVKELTELLGGLEGAYEVPSEWLLGKDILPLFKEIEDNRALQSRCRDAAKEIASSLGRLQTVTLSADHSEEVLTDQSHLQELHREILRTLNEKEPFCVWKARNAEEVRSLSEEARDNAKTVADLQNELLAEYDPEVFKIDCKAVRTRIRTEYTSFLKVLKASYKADKKQLMACRRAAGKMTGQLMNETVEKLCALEERRQWFADRRQKLDEVFPGFSIDEKTDYSALFAALDDYLLLQACEKKVEELTGDLGTLQSRADTLENHFRAMYRGVDTDWETVEAALRWAAEFRPLAEKARPGEAFLKHICSSGDFARQCLQKRPEFSEMIASLSDGYAWFANLFESPERFDDMPLDVLGKRVDDCTNHLSQLEDWIDYRSTREQCVQTGLGTYVQAIEAERIPSAHIVPMFKKRFFRMWLDAYLPEFPAVMNFRRKQQDNRVASFAELDREQFAIARGRIKSQLINSLPSMEHFTDGVDEISILKREMKKQRKIMPIRKLFAAIPNLLMTLKPCLMMSPLSVSLFLEAESYQFDLVIFDEASQVFTENAIGAISRAKQVVIAGDSKQLPPTNFFRNSFEDADFDATDEADEEEEDVFDSILEEANMLPERTLRWHYRSRHESLIAFSNAKFYKNSLITFPSNMENVPDNGVEFVYVPDGFYDRGGRKGNVNEAKRVAELVFEHFRVHPERSLGVITFGEIQQTAVETQLRKLRLENPQMEGYFREDRDEPFFVKSLENVQGDERDSIILSIGYAKDSAGVFRNQFGPLGLAGGERRLNVAVSRAKQNIKLVSSIMPEDISVDNVKNEGPVLLRSYIDYAINGPRVLEKRAEDPGVISHDSPFEEAVFNFLEKKGYKLATQVGCSGYRIDMAVRHPTVSGVFVIGIECDGASYHSAKTARERDRLRQEVLEKMGWKIYRVWSTDWIKDPVSEGEALVKAIDKAIDSYGETAKMPASAKKDKPKTPDDYMTIDKKARAAVDPANPYGFEKRQPYNLRKEVGRSASVSDYIEAVVKHEYPIHFELLCQKLAFLFGNEKATVRVRREVEDNIRPGRVKRKGDFLYPAHYDEIPVREPDGRKIQFISTDELAAAMMKILATCVGTNRDALIAETSRVYGFSRTGTNIASAMSDAIDRLIKEGKVEEVENKLRLC